MCYDAANPGGIANGGIVHHVRSEDYDVRRWNVFFPNQTIQLGRQQFSAVARELPHFSANG